MEAVVGPDEVTRLLVFHPLTVTQEDVVPALYSTCRLYFSCALKWRVLSIELNLINFFIVFFKEHKILQGLLTFITFPQNVTVLIF